MAGYDIGPRVGITGDKEFDNQLKKINNSLRECGSEMKALTSEFESNENSQEALIAKGKVLQKQLETQKSKAELLQSQYNKQIQIMKDLADAYQEAVQKSGENSKEAEKARKAFNNQADSVSKLKVAMNETDSYINKLNNSINKNGTMLKEIEDGTRDAVTGLSNLKKESKETSEALEDIGKSITAGNLMEAADAISGVGDKIKEVGEKAVGAFSDLEGTTTKVNTYFGLTGDAAEAMGKVVENVFRSGVTGSLEEVGEAVISVNNNLKDLDDAQLESLTKQAINMEQIFGSDMNETMRGVNALMVNFGLDAQTAMDYVVKGTQNGLDKTQELGDNLSEFSGKFYQAGYSAEEYFQLLQNGLGGGAYTLDYVNNAINEVTTKLTDGTIADAMGMFSQETQNTFDAWKNGQATQKDVINSIVGDIASCKDQQEQLNMAATAFGTLGEDANVEVIESLTTLGDSYKNVSGAAEEMAESATTPMQELQAAFNDMMISLAPLGEKIMELATEILPPLINGVISLIEGFMGLPEPIQIAIGVVAGILALLTTLAPIITAVVALITGFGATVLLPLVGIIATVAAAITAIILIIQNWGDIVDWVKTKWQEFKTAIGELIGEIFTGIKTALDDFGVKWTEFWGSVLGFIMNTFENIKTAMSDAWNNIKQTVGELVQNVVNQFQKFKDNVSNIWNSLVGAIKNFCNGIKNTAVIIWNNILGTIKNIAGNIKSSVENAFKNMVNGVSNTIRNLPGIFSSIFNNIFQIISNLISNAYTWGSDFINGLKDGILSGVNKIIDAVKDVASKIRSFLHFSRPDEGPLRDYETWMPDMIDGMVDGIYKNVNKIRNAANAVSGEINSTINGNVNGMLQTASIPSSNTIIVQGDTMVLDGEVVGKTVERRISNGQKSYMLSKGRRLL